MTDPRRGGRHIGRWALVCAGLLPAGCAREPATPPSAAAALQEHDRLHQRLDELVGQDPMVTQALSYRGQVQVAIRSGLATDLVREVTRRYLDRVELDLDLGKRVRETGLVHVSTPLGRIKAGEWEAEVLVHRVRGVLSAKTPQLTLAGDNRLRVHLPVEIERATGSATVRFRWNARRLTSMVCRDFEVVRTIKGRLLGREYVVAGAVALTAGPQAVSAQPAFQRSSFRLRLDLLPESWKEVQQAVKEQDKLLRCGLAIDPEEVMPRLSKLLSNGFELRLPRSVFRAVDLPGSVDGTLSLIGREVELQAETDGLDVRPEAVWYSAKVRSRRRENAPGTP